MLTKTFVEKENKTVNMAFETLRKKWTNFLGLMRMARIIGLWKFCCFFFSMLWHRPKNQVFYYKGKPIPVVGPRSVARYEKLIGEDLANFQTRDDDVFVVAFPKSGHHWSYDIINMLLKGELVLDNVVKEAYFVEFLLPAADGMSAFDRLPSPRMIYTHFHADALPREIFAKKRKVVRLIRNPKDVAVSAFHHRSAMDESLCHKMTWDEFIEEMMDVFEGKRVSDDIFLRKGGDWFTYELDCEEKLNHIDHSIVLYYEDLKEDMLPQLKRLATFLGREYDDWFLEKIAEKTNLDYVKKHKNLGMHDVLVKPGTSLYRKGVIGDWRNHFNVEQARRFDAIIESRMKGCPIMHNIRYDPRDFCRR